MKAMQRKVDARELAARLERFDEACRQAGLKLTHQRTEVFRAVASADGHPDTDEIYRRVRRRLPAISLDTIYRTLWTLKDLGLIATLGTPSERVRFDANSVPHHHFECTICGATHDLCDPELDGLTRRKSVRALGKAASCHVELRGTCAACLKSPRKKPR
ncbi:MAG: transcriptional repressor [Planctomycetes bacterium]|nr:transcriptional repressor [Planctomycetota bacterium]